MQHSESRSRARFFSSHFQFRPGKIFLTLSACLYSSGSIYIPHETWPRFSVYVWLFCLVVLQLVVIPIYLFYHFSPAAPCLLVHCFHESFKFLHTKFFSSLYSTPRFSSDSQTDAVVVWSCCGVSCENFCIRLILGTNLVSAWIQSQCKDQARISGSIMWLSMEAQLSITFLLLIYSTSMYWVHTCFLHGSIFSLALFSILVHFSRSRGNENS